MASYNKKSHNRSVSLPVRSHPSTIKIDQVVNKIKTLELSSWLNAEKVLNSLSGLQELYQCIEELLSLPQQYRETDGRLNELLDESVRYIDLCSSSRDKITLIKESICGLQSAFRRCKLGDLCIENEISAFISSRKIIQKEISKTSAKLKQTENRNILSEDQNTTVVLRAITEANVLTMSSFYSLLLFLSSPAVSKSKPSRWSLVCKKLMCKPGGCPNELESVDIALNSLINGDYSGNRRETFEFAQRKLEGLEKIMDNLENGLEVLFRHLIRTRVSLLNTFSQ